MVKIRKRIFTIAMKLLTGWGNRQDKQGSSIQERNTVWRDSSIGFRQLKPMRKRRRFLLGPLQSCDAADSNRTFLLRCSTWNPFEKSFFWVLWVAGNSSLKWRDIDLDWDMEHRHGEGGEREKREGGRKRWVEDWCGPIGLRDWRVCVLERDCFFVVDLLLGSHVPGRTMRTNHILCICLKGELLPVPKWLS